MNMRTLLPLLALLPLSSVAGEAAAADAVVPATVADEPKALDSGPLRGDWTIRADQGGCRQKVTLGEDNALSFADGVGIGTWVVHGETVQVNVQHAKMPVAETGLASRKHVPVRWSGALRRGPHGSMIGELVIEVLDDAGKVKQSRRAKFTATRS
ncbi:MAG TPA: hypothetical protein VG755_32765 [Nannocystaceae bacterium]|nr:hypothetical protein [Nannocystaceae bacterium]